MSLDLGELNITYKLDKDGLKRDLNDAEGEVKASGTRQGRAMVANALTWAKGIVSGWTAAGMQAGSAFWHAAGARLASARGPIGAAAAALGNAAAQGASQGFNLLTGGVRMLMGALGRLNIDTSTAIKIFLIFHGILLLLVPAAQLLGGVLGAIPALVTGGIAAVATLGLGMIGLSDAFKKTAASGGSVVDRAHQVMLAERRLADATRESLAAQTALNKARAQAADRLRDLQTSVTAARLDEADAVDAVKKAERDLERAREGGNEDQITAAERALERANNHLAAARARYEDLTEEQAEAAAKGVEGSDEVTAALDRQRRATEGISDATYDLRRAQQSTSGGAAAEVTKIAVSAQLAVNAIKGLKGEFDGLRLDIQEKLFAGTDIEIKSLWDSWLPTLRARLGSMATMFNGQFKEWAKTSRKPEFIANIAAGWEGVEALIDRVGKAVAGPGLEAFGKLSRAARPMLDAIGDVLGGVVEDFATWIDEAEKSGDLQKFFENAGVFFKQVSSITGSTLSIIGSIISILAGGSEKGRETAMEGFVVTMDKLAAWFDDPANQEKIQSWFLKLEEWIFWIVETGIPTVKKWIDKIDEWATRIDGWIQKVRDFERGVVGAIDSVTSAVTGMPGRITAATSGMWDGIKNSFKGALNYVIDKWNALEFPSMSIAGVTITAPLRTPNIPPLASGGLVRATPGGRVVNVAEAGQDEIVSPVSQMRQIVAEELARVHAEGGSGPRVIEIPIYIGDEVVRVVRYELTEHDRKANRAATAGAGTR